MARPSSVIRQADSPCSPVSLSGPGSSTSKSARRDRSRWGHNGGLSPGRGEREGNGLAAAHGRVDVDPGAGVGLQRRRLLVLLRARFIRPERSDDETGGNGA